MRKSASSVYKQSFGVRLRSFRREKDMTQNELFLLIREHDEKLINSVSTLASWEQGRKLPSLDVIILLTKLFGCSLDYILGLTDQIDVKNGNQEDYNDLKREISFRDLKKFDRMPIYVVFPDMERENQYGILDFTNMKIRFLNEEYPILVTNTCQYYVSIPHYCDVFSSQGKNFITNTDAIMNAENLYIEVKSLSSTIREEYNGWYKHNETHTCFINEKGLTLPYVGLNLNYFVYDIYK